MIALANPDVLGDALCFHTIGLTKASCDYRPKAFYAVPWASASPLCAQQAALPSDRYLADDVPHNRSAKIRRGWQKGTGETKMRKCHGRPVPSLTPPCLLECANGRGRFGGTAGGHPKACPRPRQPLFAVPSLRELESARRVSIL